MEIIAALVIVALLAVVAIPSYKTMMTQGAANAAQNNLSAIYNAQKTYYFSNGSYYISASCPSSDITNINSTLSLNITDNNFTYCCTNTNNFTCKATNIADANLYLTVTNSPIILIGGTSVSSGTCTTPFICTTSAEGCCNPTCATDIAAYCPSTSF